MLHFGTDGVRGVALEELTAESVRDLGRAVARVLSPSAVVVGRDTRRSGPALESALVQGIASEGVPVKLLGVAPTPAVAFAAERSGWVGVSITASHNPWTDNGIKVFGVGGLKLTDAEQIEIERQWHAVNGEPLDAVAPETEDVSPLIEDYARHRASVTGGLEGLVVVIDCGNGAMSGLAERVLTAAGATVVSLFDQPDGTNINDGCGATDTSAMAARLGDLGADLGLAFDGDGDRVIAVCSDGTVVDGDRLLAMAAVDLAGRGLLRNKGVAVTVMSNLGFHRAMAAADIAVVTTPVGDRSVLLALDEHDLVLGGEQSGHVIYRAHATTGDGLLAGLFLCDMVRRSGSTLRALADGAMEQVPQVLVNVPVRERIEDPAALLAERIDAVSRRLGEQGRVLVRSSGTEPLVRIMVEAVDGSVARSVAEELRSAVESLAG